MAVRVVCEGVNEIATMRDGPKKLKEMMLWTNMFTEML